MVQRKRGLLLLVAGAVTISTTLFIYCYITKSNNSFPIDVNEFDDQVQVTVTNTNNTVTNKSVTTPSTCAKCESVGSTRFSFFHTNFTTESFTVVMPTYRRTKQLPTLLKHYCKVPHVHKIVVLWNNVDQTIPKHISDFKCEVPVAVLKMKENKVSNRFKLYPEIETEAIFSTDDDRMVDGQSMTLGFNSWKMFNYLLMGFCERTHHLVGNHYAYGDYPLYSMILTGSVFIHRKYIEMYNNELPRKLFNFVDTHQNGEDIIMNAMIADFLKRVDRPQCPGVLVQGSTKEISLSEEGHGGLLQRKDHVRMRSKCLDLINEVYGYMPLIYCSIKITSY
jgi:alpha-1,4-N-acetylglucosaminyltransferase EXTL2